MQEYHLYLVTKIYNFYANHGILISQTLQQNWAQTKQFQKFTKLGI